MKLTLSNFISVVNMMCSLAVADLSRLSFSLSVIADVYLIFMLLY